jgi:hypothetical protein
MMVVVVMMMMMLVVMLKMMINYLPTNLSERDCGEIDCTALSKIGVYESC